MEIADSLKEYADSEARYKDRVNEAFNAHHNLMLQIRDMTVEALESHNHILKNHNRHIKFQNIVIAGLMIVILFQAILNLRN